MNNRMTLELPSLSANGPFARDTVAAFCAQLDPSLDELSDVKTAVSEAITNCIVHAYPDGPGTVRIECAAEKSALHIRIIDYGRGIADVPRALEPFYTTLESEERSGMGFTIMQAFMTDFSVYSEPGKGTTVSMRKEFLRGGAREEGACPPKARAAGRRRKPTAPRTQRSPMLAEEETLRLIRAAKQGDENAKAALLENNVSLLKSIVRRYLGKGTEYDDLFQLAGIGLLKAVNGFDETYGVRFSTYAVPMIAGEIKRFLRDDGSVKVSRAMKAAARSMNKFIQEYSAEHGDAPSLHTIAEKFGMSESEAVFVLGSSRMPLSIDEPGEYKDEKARTLLDKLPSADSQEEIVEKLQLKNAIEHLSERARKIIFLRYFRDMTQSEVATVIGVSQVQISRIESKTMAEMKKMLG